MKSGLTPKSIIAVFLVVAAFYFGGFYGLEYLRVRKGPWEVTFEPSVAAPAIVIRQPSVGVENVRLIFPGESVTNPAQAGTVRFDKIDKAALFGEVIYEDPMFLPGVMTFNLFGHEIELMPRVLVINKREVPWQSGAVLEVWPTNKPATPPKSPPGNRPTVQR
jgi:hypothetical protein